MHRRRLRGFGRGGHGVTRQALQDLIAAFYDAAVDASQWPAATTRMIRVFGGTTGMIQMMDLKSWEVTYIGVVGFSDSDIREYLQHYYMNDIWVQAGAKQPIGTAHLLNDLVPDRVFERSEIWNDFGKRVGPGVFHCVGATVDVDPRKIGVVGIHRPQDTSDFTPNDRNLLRVLLPHLQRTLMLSQRLAVAEQQTALTYAAMDHLAIGIVITRADSTVIFANAAARAMAGARNGFGLGNGQTGVTAARLSETAQLRTLIARAAQTTVGNGFNSGGAMRLSRPSLQRAYTVVVSPLSLRSIVEPAALILITDPEQPPNAPVDQLARLHGLTPAEARLAAALASGGSLKDYAEEAHVSSNTARWTLKQIFAKTETHRQSELVRLLATISVA